MSRLVLASRNKGKLREIQQLLVSTGWSAVSCEVFPDCPDPEETGKTFAENALIKANAVAEFTGAWTLADDSGLEVDALNGAPGVHSARFSGKNATDSSNNTLLLSRLSNTASAERTARFRCAICIVAPDGRHWTTDGRCEGVIGTEPAGNSGFGYDPLFTPQGYDRTFGQLDPDTKNLISHRGQAIREACRLLASLDI